MAITTESIVQRDPEQIFSEIEGEVVLLNIETGRYFKIDEIGSDIWEMIEEQTKVSDLCIKLSKEYEITPEECQPDVIAFLEQLEQCDLLVNS